MVIHVLHVTGVNLGLAAQHGLQSLWHLVPCRDLLVPCGQLAIRGNYPKLFLARKSLLAQFVPTLIKFSFVLVSPLLRNVVRGVSSPGSEINEEWFVGGQRFLLPDPGKGFVSHVRDEVIPFFRRLLRLHRSRAFVQRRIPLTRFAPYEAIEIFKTSAPRWPCIEWPYWTRLPYRHLVTFSELSSGVAVELERSRQRRHGVRQY